MAQLLSDRYQLEIRLDRDGDVVEWLGTDRALDRPVLVRILDPAAGEERVAAFLNAVRDAAAVGHNHLDAVYAADALGAGGAYAVQEWAGGVTLADRLGAGEPLPLEDFLPNAAGLADALAALHAAGIVHGGINAGAILFSAAHPAKLAGYGRDVEGGDPAADVRDLAGVLAAAATGRVGAPPGMRPSDVRAGLPRQVDQALLRARQGELDAAGLAASLHAAPTARRDRPGGGWTWRWAVAVAALVAAAAIVAAVGLALRVRPSGARLLFPAAPVPTSATAPGTTAAPPPTAPAAAGARPAPAPEPVVTAAGVYDPFGDDRERDDDLPLLLDGDPATGWRTERYLDPLGAVKGGVGVTFAVDRAPDAVEILATPGTEYSLAWSPAVPPEFAGWEATARGRTVGGRARVQLPPRDGGTWLLWLTDVPAQEGGEFYYAHVYEVRFRP